MSIMDILIRSMSGYIFVVPIVLFYFLYLKKAKKKQTLLHNIIFLAFCYYIIGVLTMTGIGKLHSFSPNIVLIPFVDMIRGPIDTLLNIVLFVPLGFFIPFLYKKYKNIGNVTLIGFLLSLSIEIVQMFGRGSTDINDLITNTLGTILGYGFYKLLFKVMQKDLCKKTQSNMINEKIELLFFVVCSFVIMVTVQPYIIGKFFRLG